MVSFSWLVMIVCVCVCEKKGTAQPHGSLTPQRSGSRQLLFAPLRLPLQWCAC